MRLVNGNTPNTRKRSNIGYYIGTALVLIPFASVALALAILSVKFLLFAVRL